MASSRSSSSVHDQQFKPDPGVVPLTLRSRAKAGITAREHPTSSTTTCAFRTRGRLPPGTRSSPFSTAKFLADTDSDVAPVDTRNAPLKILEPGSVSLYVPVDKQQSLTDKFKKAFTVKKTEKETSHPLPRRPTDPRWVAGRSRPRLH